MLIYNVHNSLLLNVNAINHNTLLPGPLHVAGNHFGSFLGHESPNDI